MNQINASSLAKNDAVQLLRIKIINQTIDVAIVVEMLFSKKHLDSWIIIEGF